MYLSASDKVKELFTNCREVYCWKSLDSPDEVIACVFAADFFQLLFVCLQWRAFRLEHSTSQRHEAEDNVSKFDGGSNAGILKDIENGQSNPYDDFLSYKK